MGVTYNNASPKPKKLDMDTTFLVNHLSNRRLQTKTMWRNGIQEAIEVPNIQDVANIWKAKTKASVGGAVNEYTGKMKVTSPTKLNTFEFSHYEDRKKMKIVEN